MKTKTWPITEGICSKKCQWFDEDRKNCRVILALMNLSLQDVSVEVGVVG